MDLQPSRPLLAGDDVHRPRERGDGRRAAWDARHVVSGDAQLQASRVEQPRGDVLQLQRRQLRELLVDALEDVVVQVPRLVEFLLAPRLAVLLAPLVRLLELAAVHLHEGNLVQRLRAEALDDVVQRREHPEHPVHVLLPEVQLRRLLERLVPRLVPQNGDANQLERHHLGLLHEQRAVLPEVIQHHHRRRAPRRGLRLTRDEQRVQKRLRVLPPHANQELVNQRAHGQGVAVDPRDDLGNHREPRVDADVTEPLHQRRLHLGRRAVVEPQRQKTQNILKRPALPLLRRRAAQSDGPEKTGNRGSDVTQTRRSRTRVLGVVLHRRRVEQSPVVPSLGPLATRVRRGPKRRQHVRHRPVVHVLRDRPAPLTELQKRASDQFRGRRGARPERSRRRSRPEGGGIGGQEWE